MIQPRKFNPTMKQQLIDNLQERIELTKDMLATMQATLQVYNSCGAEWTNDYNNAILRIRQEQEIIQLRMSHNNDNCSSMSYDLFLPDSENGGLD